MQNASRSLHGKAGLGSVPAGGIWWGRCFLRAQLLRKTGHSGRRGHERVVARYEHRLTLLLVCAVIARPQSARRLPACDGARDRPADLLAPWKERVSLRATPAKPLRWMHLVARWLASAHCSSWLPSPAQSRRKNSSTRAIPPFKKRNR